MPTLRLLDAADTSLRNTIRHLTRHARGGTVHEDDGLFLFAGACDTQHPYINGVIRTDARIRPAELLGRARPFFGALGRPFVLWASSHRDADIQEQAVAEGYFSHRPEGSPGMMLGDDPGIPQTPPRLKLAMVDSSRLHRDFIAVTEQAYAQAMTPEVTRAIFADIATISGPEVRALVASEAGVPLAAAMATVYDGLGEIGFVGTVATARGRGLGRLVTQACAHDAFVRGARRVFLQASTMGEPVYRALGFVELTRYVKFEVPEA